MAGQQRRPSVKRKSFAAAGPPLSTAGADTSALSAVNESLLSGNFMRLAKELAERDQGVRPPKMQDFKTSVFNRNSKPDTLVSYIVPNEEQKAKRAALKEAQEQAEREREERADDSLIPADPLDMPAPSAFGSYCTTLRGCIPLN